MLDESNGAINAVSYYKRQYNTVLPLLPLLADVEQQ